MFSSIFLFFHPLKYKSKVVTFVFKRLHALIMNFEFNLHYQTTLLNEKFPFQSNKLHYLG